MTLWCVWFRVWAAKFAPCLVTVTAEQHGILRFLGVTSPAVAQLLLE